MEISSFLLQSAINGANYETKNYIPVIIKRNSNDKKELRATFNS